MQKRIAITGAGSGLGLALARKYASEGWRVAVTDIDDERVNTAVEEVRRCGGESIGLKLDVRLENDFRELAERLERRWSGLDVVVNNAGVAGAGTVIDTPLEDWQWIIDIDLMGVVRGCHILAPLLVRQQSGHIVNIASFAGIAQTPAVAAYNTAKTGVIGLSESLRHEMAEHGVGVSVVCPSFFQTQLLQTFRSPDPQLRTFAEKMFQRATVSADEVASDVYDAVRQNRFMVITHRDARWLYRLKRLSPDYFFRLVHKKTRALSLANNESKQ